MGIRQRRHAGSVIFLGRRISVNVACLCSSLPPNYSITHLAEPLGLQAHSGPLLLDADRTWELVLLSLVWDRAAMW